MFSLTQLQTIMVAYSTTSLNVDNLTSTSSYTCMQSSASYDSPVHASWWRSVEDCLRYNLAHSLIELFKGI